MTAPRWQQRALALAVLAAMLTAIHGLAVSPWLSHHAAKTERLVALAAQRQRFLDVAGREPSLSAQLTDIERATGGYLPGQTPALAAAWLQERVRSTVAGGDGRLSSTQVLPPEPGDGGIVRVGIRVAFLGSSDALLLLVHALESAGPVLLLEEISIRRLDSQRFGGRNDGPEQLDTHFDLLVFMREAT